MKTAFIATRPYLRQFSQRFPGTPRVVASMKKLKNLRPSQAQKFPWKDDIDGFVFLDKGSDMPVAYLNRCSHISLEMDLNDSDFLYHGFIQCKVHGAIFDAGRSTSSSSSSRVYQPLQRVPVHVEGDLVYISSNIKPEDLKSQCDVDFLELRSKMQDLQHVFDSEMQQRQMEDDVAKINLRSLQRIDAMNKRRKK